MTIRDYSTTAASNNAAPPNGWPEGQAASTVNDCGRQMMADIRETFEELPYFDYGDDPTRVDNDTFTVAGDLTTRYPVGARVKLVGATTGIGRITVSSHAAGTTTIDVVMDSGNVPLTLTRVSVNQVGAESTATPAAVTLTASTGTSAGLSRDDHVHALSQDIAPTMTATWTFSKAATNASDAPIIMASSSPRLVYNETDGSSDNKWWNLAVSAEQFKIELENDAHNAAGTAMTVDRTGTTVDRVHFPADGTSGRFLVGDSSFVLPGALAQFSSATASTIAVSASSPTALSPTMASHNRATAGDNVFLEFGTEASFTSRGKIDYNRAGTAVRYNTTCDRELKQEIADSDSAMSLLSQFRIRKFRWKGNDYQVDHGFIAQEVHEVYPDAVSRGDENRPWSMDFSKLTPILVKAVQEQQAQIESLSRDFEQLMARIAGIERSAAGGKP